MEMVKIRPLRMVFVSKWDHDPNRNSELHLVYRHIPAGFIHKLSVFLAKRNALFFEECAKLFVYLPDMVLQPGDLEVVD